MKLFRTWSRAQIVTAIQSLEEVLQQGVQSVSNPAQGSVSYSSPEHGFRMLRSLYARLDELDGVKTQSSGPRVINQRITGGSL
jgi:hypothetical protein